MVAQMAEEYEGIGNELGRQILRTRRSFTASVFSADGSQVLFRVKRPAYLITSTMFIESGDGEAVGEIHRRWSFTNRSYDLYLNKQQFASITGGFLAWEFELKDKEGGTLALIDRNFQGFAKEIFTDAGKYVIHFGQPASNEASSSTSTSTSTSPPVTTMAKLRTGVQVIPTASGGQIAVARRLELSERMIALACAISIDYDFFSQHSHGSGLISPGVFSTYPGGNVVPVPMPGGDPVIPSEDISGSSPSPDSALPPASDSTESGWGSEGPPQPEHPPEDSGWSWDDGKKEEGGGGGEGGEGEGGGSLVGQVVKGIFGWPSSDD